MLASDHGTFIGSSKLTRQWETVTARSGRLHSVEDTSGSERRVSTPFCRMRPAAIGQFVRLHISISYIATDLSRD